MSSIWIKDIPSNDFSGNIKEINSDNFVTQFEGKVTLKRVGKNYKMVWYVSGGEIVKKTILVPSTSTKTVTSKPSISAETTAYYQVYFNSSGEDEIEDTWDLGWLEEVTVNNNYGGSEPDYGYNGSGLYGDMGYYDPYSYGENGGDTYDGAGGGASSSGSSSSGGTDTDDPPSCESFNFVNTTSLWQVALVKNVHFKVFLVNDKGIEILHVIEFPQPISFGAPTNLIVGGTNITPGIAANTSARVLQKAMQETVDRYGHTRISDLTVSLYFQERLKYNYPLHLPGGRVNFNATENLPVSEYKTNIGTSGNCN